MSVAMPALATLLALAIFRTLGQRNGTRAMLVLVAGGVAAVALAVFAIDPRALLPASRRIWIAVLRQEAYLKSSLAVFGALFASARVLIARRLDRVALCVVAVA